MALTQVNSAGIADGAIVNSDINNSAAVALSKLATSGTASSSNYLRGDGAWSAIDLSTKLNLTGGVMTGSLRLNDNLELQLGSSGSDLKLFHNGTDSYIHNSTGNLVLRGDFVQINNAANSEGMAWFSANAQVGLKYDNSTKIETASYGVAIHEDTNKVIRFTGSIGEIGNVTGFQATNTANDALTSFGMRATDLRFATGSAERLRLDSNGDLGLGTTAVPQDSGARTLHIHDSRKR